MPNGREEIAAAGAEREGALRPALPAAEGPEVPAEEDRARSLREQVLAARRAAAAGREGPPGAPAPAEGVGPAAGTNELTKRLLNWSWLALLKSFGLTLIYINFHFFAKYFPNPITNRYFCRFGEETLPPGQNFQNNTAVVPRLIGYLEIFGVILINAAIVGLLFALAALVYILFADPCKLLEAGLVQKAPPFSMVACQGVELLFGPTALMTLLSWLAGVLF